MQIPWGSPCFFVCCAPKKRPFPQPVVYCFDSAACWYVVSFYVSFSLTVFYFVLLSFKKTSSEAICQHKKSSRSLKSSREYIQNSTTGQLFFCTLMNHFSLLNLPQPFIAFIKEPSRNYGAESKRLRMVFLGTISLAHGLANGSAAQHSPKLPWRSCLAPWKFAAPPEPRDETFSFVRWGPWRILALSP